MKKFLVIISVLCMNSALFAADSQKLPTGHPKIEGSMGNGGAVKTEAVKVGKIKKADGGNTVEECFNGKTKLNGKSVIVRGKVVKYNSGILKKNWLHIQDGSGTEGKNDLVVTTNDTAKLGDTVVVTGKMSYEKDLGAGYFFPAIIEDGKVKTEK